MSNHDKQTASNPKTAEPPTKPEPKPVAVPDSNTKVGEAPTVIEAAPNARAGESPRRDTEKERK